MKGRARPKLLAVASGGGHWVQLMRIRPAFEGARVVFATVEPSYRAQVGDAKFRLVCDATRWNKFRLILLLFQITLLILRERPDVIVSTGAAPGYLAIRIGKLIGARTMWIDSIANVECLSLSGKKIRSHADVCLTQWEHLARTGGPSFEGAVL